MQAPYRTMQFDWLVDPDQPAATFSPQEDGIEWYEYPIPATLGNGGFQKIELTLNMSLFRGVHHFTPEAVGRMIPLAAVAVDFAEPTFMTQVMRGGRILHREASPEMELQYSPGLDLFRLTEQFRVVPVLDGSRDSEMTCLVIGLTMLGKLVGTEVAERLLQALGLTSCPSVVVRPIPLHVSAHLHGAIGNGLVGAARRLYCQARALDYLVELVDTVLAPDTRQERNSATRERAREVREYLLAITGELPSLEQLAQHFSCSARKLNDEFRTEYGQSLYSFITSHRLEEAHAAIAQTDIPLKRLAERLGYAHVSNFSIAFKRRFGYPPGSLRRNKA